MELWKLTLELRGQIWRTQDWFARLVELEWEAKRVSDPWQRSQSYLALARISDSLVPDRQRALSLYQKAWQATGECTPALTISRAIYRELGELAQAAEVAEVEYRFSEDPALLAIAGETWLDAGDNTRAAQVLARAAELLGNDEEVMEALALARGLQPSDVGRLEREAAGADAETASRKLMHAALIIRTTHPKHPLYESLLRRSLDIDPRNGRAATLLEQLLERDERWVEYIELQEMRADTAPSDRERVDTYRRGGIGLTVRHKQQRAGARLLATALAVAYERRVEDIPGHLAMLTLLRNACQAADQIDQICTLYDRALQAPLSEDERLFISSVAGKTVWKQVGDAKRAEKYFTTVKSIVPDHPLVDKFERGAGVTLQTPRRVAEAEQHARQALLETEQKLAAVDTRRYIEARTMPGKDFKEQRVSERIRAFNVVKVNLSAPVDVTQTAGKDTFAAFTRDLSETGMFIKSDKKVSTGTQIKVTLRIPSAEGWDEDAFELTATVVRVDEGVGFGLTLQSPPAAYRDKVRSLIS